MSKSMRDKVKDRANKRKNLGGGSKYDVDSDIEFFQHEKKILIDILPYVTSNNPEVDAGETWYQRTVFVHYNVGIQESSRLCPKTIGKPCPICNYAKELAKNKDADKEEIKALRPKERELFNVIDLNEPDKGVQLWEISFHNFGKQLEEEIREGDDAWAGFSDLEGGMSLQVRFSKESFQGGNPFLKASRIDFIERDGDYEDSTLEGVFDLDNILVVWDYEDLEKEFFGMDMDAPEEGEEAGEVEESTETEEAGEDDDVPMFSGEDKGAGEVEEQQEAEEPEPEVDEKGDDEKQPYCPGEFGRDYGQYSECDKCGDWEVCQDAHERLARKATGEKGSKEPSKKAPAKKTVAKKAPAKKTVAKKAPAKKKETKKAPAKKKVAKKTVSKRTK